LIVLFTNFDFYVKSVFITCTLLYANEKVDDEKVILHNKKILTYPNVNLT